MAGNETFMLVEIIYDPSCPWCYIGKRQLDAALAARPGVRVRRRWWPFLINPDLPSAGLDRADFLTRKFGSEARVSRLYRAIAHVGRSVRIDFDFERIDRVPNSLHAHRLVCMAARAGRADAAVEALFESHFVRGLDIGNRLVLAQIGASIGLQPSAVTTYLMSDADTDLVLEENTRAQQLGINGVPAFVFAGMFVVCGAQDPKALTRMLDAARTAGAARIRPRELVR
ncbi:Predicted dithiol-disulfide isomerase involved in polyketide biosynthesis [Candidatus Defluviicoccus seviourii]|uniref:Predicted dithiol-disulfide isomerase involved in polyketide biosynthesis n=1 Tax=Candidatus Defluviicoccus seviourii TaxID=2565273 RepID=A0A564WGY5_9PROT|nr:Predicted dithiol-disulfide isomerase involved in polyketide biosynthesis [Candidatus Defluviicoccus seviourii]